MMATDQDIISQMKFSLEFDEKTRGPYLFQAIWIDTLLNQIISYYFCTTDLKKQGMLIGLVLNEISFNSKIKYFLKILELYPKMMVKYPKIETKLDNIRDFRNKIAHSKLDDESKLLLHPEYPTRKRFIREKSKNEEYTMEKHSFPLDKKLGKRGHYDFVVLNNEFYKKYRNNLDKLSNKTVMVNKDVDYKYIDIAIEFKFITKNLDVDEIKFDLFKLNQAEEVEAKLFIIFINCTSHSIETPMNYFSDKITPLHGVKEHNKKFYMFS